MTDFIVPLYWSPQVQMPGTVFLNFGIFCRFPIIKCLLLCFDSLDGEGFEFYPFKRREFEDAMGFFQYSTVFCTLPMVAWLVHVFCFCLW
jgi:hypothetical protein